MAVGNILGQMPGVQSINKLTPNAEGDVTVGARDVKAIPNEALAVKTANLDNGAVNTEKLALNAVTEYREVVIGRTANWQPDPEYSGCFKVQVSVAGLKATNHARIDVKSDIADADLRETVLEQFGYMFRFDSVNGGLVVRTTEKNTVDITIKVEWNKR